ncbi:CbtA family protein [Nocardia tengchongensis]|uniref:CbtA family protein n=1 Tax=Nocardia tengchongensis TaxID=2055889 RepID=A0ABX8CT59_9NOCA|nr:CbtA family protein [Nocardia tengchongensis]QVI21370.1 CbtA family protein [Nocardia tengchongensis]
MEKRIIGRGVLLGALGGSLAFVFARILTEPIIDRAIAYEEGRDDAQMALDKAAGKSMDMEHGAELFTRAQQQNVGLGFGMIVFGAALGALFAVVYFLALRKSGKISPRNLALLVSGGMFLVLYAVPFLKYPANPPSIGHPETIGARTALYVGMMVISAVVLCAAIWAGRKLAARLDNWTATVAASAGFVVVMGAVLALLPSLGHLSANKEYGDFATETPQPLKDPSGTIVFPGFSADDLYHFRLYSFAAQLIVWAVIGVGFAWLAPRLLGDRATETARAA